MVWWLLAACVEPTQLTLRADVLDPEGNLAACGGDRSIEAGWDDAVIASLPCQVTPEYGAVVLAVRQADADAPPPAVVWEVDGEAIDLPVDWRRGAAWPVDDGTSRWTPPSAGIATHVAVVQAPRTAGDTLTVSVNQGGLRSLRVPVPVRPARLSLAAATLEPRQVGLGDGLFVAQTTPPLEGAAVTMRSYVDDRPIGHPIQVTLDSWGIGRGVLPTPWLPGAWTVEATTHDLVTRSVAIPLLQSPPLELSLSGTRPDILNLEAVRSATPPRRAVSERGECASVTLLAGNANPPFDPRWRLTQSVGAIDLGDELRLNDAGVAARRFQLTDRDLLITYDHPELPPTTLRLALSPMRPSLDSLLRAPQAVPIDALGTALSTIRVDILRRIDLPPGVFSDRGAPDVALVLRPHPGVPGMLPCGAPADDSRIACDPLDVDPSLHGDCWLLQEPEIPGFGVNDVPLSPGICWAGTVDAELWARTWTEINDDCVGEWPVGPWTLVSSSPITFAPEG